MVNARHTIKGLRWWIILLVMLGTITNYLARSTLGIAAPTFMKDLHLSIQQYSYIVSVFPAAYAIGGILCGYLLDYLGVKFGYALCAVLWSLLNMLHGLAQGWPLLAFLRGGLGLTEAAAIPSGMKVTAEWFPARERGLAGGLFNIGTSVGAMLAPPLVVWAILHYNWRMAFVVTGAIGLVWALIWLLCYRPLATNPALSDEERDYIRAGQEAHLKTACDDKGRSSVLSVVLQRNFWGIALPRFLADPAWGTLGYWMPLYLITVRHMELKQIALFAWLPFLTADLGCLFSGTMCALLIRYCNAGVINARRITFSFGAVLMLGAGFVGFVDNVYTAIALFCLIGFAHQCLSTTVITMSSDLFARDQVGRAAGCAVFVGSSGNFLFSLVMGGLIASVGYSPFFVCIGLMDLFGAMLLWGLVRERREA